MLKIGGQEFTYGVWDPIQWLHSGRDLAVEFDTQIPTKQRGTYQQQSNLLLVKDGSARVVDIGSRPAVSPISDRIAYYGRDGVVAVNADETGKAVLAKAPATLFSKEGLFWNIVWSPCADHRPGESDFFVPHAGRLPVGRGVRGWQRLDHPQLAPGRQGFSRHHFFWRHRRRSRPQYDFSGPRNSTQRAARQLHQRGHP